MTDNNVTDGQTLVERLQQNDATAFTQLYKAHWYQMFLVAYRKLNDKESAEELVQEIFTRLWKNRATAKIDNIEFYLFSAVRYEVINCIRSRIVQDAYTDHFHSCAPPEGFTTEDTIAFNELVSLIEQGLRTLPPKSGEVFRLSRFESLTIPQIAQRLQLSEKTVEYHLSKALKHLRGYIIIHSSGH
jgi:RNA polymerase sigma-70 factor (family 1)